jgi:hypothetical protein
MNKALEKNKSIVISVVIFVVAILAYNYLWKGSQEIATQGITVQNIGNDVVDLNNKLQAVTLDQGIFTTVEYRSLTDWNSSFTNNSPRGRIDPFAQIGQ